MTKEFLQWLDDQIAFYKNQVPMLVFKNDVPSARTATGTLKAYQEIADVLAAQPESAPAAEDAPFVDPATRLSLRKDV